MTWATSKVTPQKKMGEQSRRRLQQIRHLESLTMAAASELWGLPPSTYSAIERGERSGSVEANRLGYSEDRLRTPVPSMSEPMHRQRASVGVKIQRTNAEVVRLAGELLIESRATRDRVPAVRLRRLSAPTGFSDIEEMAEECRLQLGISRSGPILNLTAAVERAGVCLTPIHDDHQAKKRVDGLSSWVAEQPTIGLNPDAPGDRYRLTLAHELGHLLMHDKKSPVVESEANYFASCLLVPTDEFLEAIGGRPTIQSFVRLKEKWGISIAAGIYRANQLDVIDEHRYRSLQIQTAKWRRHEPGAFPIRPGRLLPRLIEIAGGVDAASRQLGIASHHLERVTVWDRPSPKLAVIEGEGSGPSDLEAPRQARLTLVE